MAVPALRDLLATRPVTLAQLAGATVAAVLPAVVLVTTRARLAPGRHG